MPLSYVVGVLVIAGGALLVLFGLAHVLRVGAEMGLWAGVSVVRPSLGSCVGGLLLTLISELALAIRDIARNSFRY